MDKARLKMGSVPVRIAARVYGRDPAWVRAGIIAGWLPIGEATRNGKRITDVQQMNSAFSIALWGEDRSRGGSNNYYGNNRGQRNSYDGYYQGSQNNRPNPPPVRRSLQNLDFESRGDAEDTLAGLRDALYRYRQVSVGDLWDLMGVTNDSTDYNYGWYNLDDAFIKGIPGGFRLILPHTVPLR